LWVEDKKEPDVTKAAKLVDEHTEVKRALEAEYTCLQRTTQATHAMYNENTRQPATTYSNQSSMNQDARGNTFQDYRTRGQTNWSHYQDRPYCTFCKRYEHDYDSCRSKNNYHYSRPQPRYQRPQPGNTCLVKPEEGKLCLNMKQDNRIPVRIRGCRLSAVVDTGSKYTLIDSRICDKLVIRTKIPQV
jgi:hypothetical protein